MKGLSEDITVKAIITYKEDNGIVYGYLNQEELDIALYERAKIRSHDFEDKNQIEDERKKRAVRLDDISIQRHSIIFRPVSEGDYISEGDVILDVGLDSLYSGNYFRENNISEYKTSLCCGIRIFSCYSGYFSCKIEDRIIGNCNLSNTIKDGDLLFTIKLAEKPKEADVSIKDIVFKYDLLSIEFLESIPYLSGISISKWLVDNYTNVKKGDALLEVTELTVMKPKFQTIIKSPYSGLLVKRYDSMNRKLFIGTTLFTIYSDERHLKDSFPYKFIVTKDDFTKNTIIQCEATGKYGLSSDGFCMDDTLNCPLYFNFENVSGRYYLLMLFNMKAVRIDKQCSLHLLLDNGIVITVSPIANPTRSGFHSMCKFSLSSADMDGLENSRFTKWRITNGEGVAIKDGNNICCCDVDDATNITQALSYDVFQSFIKDFRNVVKKNVPQEQLEENNETETIQKECYVYLMIDTTNNFHKIGISNKPKYREHTLQSDKPTIELVCSKAFPTRAVAEAFESSLHRVYASKRIRGEWFNLDDADVEVIKQALK